MSISAQDKPMLERKWSDALMSHNQAWGECRSMHRLYAQPGKDFVVWRYADKPVILEVYRIALTKLHSQSGVSFMMVTTKDDESKDFVVTHTPVEIPALGVFIWIPAFADLRFTPMEYAEANSPRTLHIPFCIKTCTNPEKELKVGGTYLTSKTEFIQTYPNTLL